MVDITKEDVTGIEINAAGTFDHLANAMRAQVNEEYTKERIRQVDYATVLTATLSTTMQQAITFELNKGINARQEELLAAQIAQTNAETDGVLKQNELIDCQIEKCKAEVILLNKEAEKSDLEIINLGIQNEISTRQRDRLDEEIALLKEQILNTIEERAQIIAQTALIGKQEEKLDQDILVAQQEVLKAIEEVQLIIQQVKNLQADFDKTTAETAFTQQRTVNAGEELLVLKEQRKKIVEEIALLAQKVKTEIAQIRDQVDDIDVAGVIGRKNLLFVRQADGFLRDAEQKAAKIFSDIFNIAKSADPDAVPNIEALGIPDYFETSETDPDTGNPVFLTRPANPQDTYARLTAVLTKLQDGVISE